MHTGRAERCAERRRVDQVAEPVDRDNMVSFELFDDRSLGVFLDYARRLGGEDVKVVVRSEFAVTNP